ncbi:MAG: hypothetical protein N2Z76_00310 [Treponemataceae bacterium]|nr:hypothetical protein [Treponemataceae bacterium]
MKRAYFEKTKETTRDIPPSAGTRKREKPPSLVEGRISDPLTEGVENPCHLCAPLGAVVFFAGLERGITILHGSQGCSTYVRRYLISHFREPIDVASSNFIETSAIFGGKDTVRQAIGNVIRQYRPTVIGLATTCLVETMGEDIGALVKEMESLYPDVLLVPVSTPAFLYNHREGFQLAQSALVRALAAKVPYPLKGRNTKTGAPFSFIPLKDVNSPLWNELALRTPQDKGPTIVLFPPFASVEDIRWYRGLGNAFGIRLYVIGDYSTTLDSGPWFQYGGLAPGGTPPSVLGTLFNATAAIGVGTLPLKEQSPHLVLKEYTGMEVSTFPLPIGLFYTDLFMKGLAHLGGQPIPVAFREERERLQDAYVDAHKYVADVPCAVIGDEDLVLSLASFLLEIGARPVLCASGGKTGYLRRGMMELQNRGAPCWPSNFEPVILCGTDFKHIEVLAERLKVRLIIGSSKAYPMARTLKIPLVRCGFPIHDRFGAAQTLHVGYKGTYELLRLVVNTLIEAEQDTNPVGYTYY